MEENGFVVLQFVGLVQQVLGGEFFEYYCGGLFEVDVVGQVDQFFFCQYMQFVVGVQWVGGVGDVVVDFEMGYFVVYCFDFVGIFVIQF